MVRHHPNGIRSPHEEESLTKTDMMAHVKHTCGLRWAIPIPLDTQAVQRLTKSELRTGKECWVCVENTEKKRNGGCGGSNRRFSARVDLGRRLPYVPTPILTLPNGCTGMRIQVRLPGARTFIRVCEPSGNFPILLLEITHFDGGN